MQAYQHCIADEFEAVNRVIVEQLKSRVGMIEDIGHYITEAGGKRLRPALVLLGAGATGKLDSQHIELAAVIEFIHTATLLHDDVVDLSELRRGRLTANAQWGNAPSVLVGDFIYSRSFQLMAKLKNNDIIQLLAETTNRISEGEVLQLTKAGDPTTSTEDYYDVIESKTAVLFAAAAKSGAVLNKASESEQQSLYSYGLNLGTAFQLIDDALDYQGKAEEMGKNVGDDLAEGKPTLPLIYVMENGSQEQKDIVETAIKTKSKENLSAICDAVKQSGALKYTHEQAAIYSRKALQQLDSLADNIYITAMKDLANKAINRKT